jgi:uncharacterized protein (DUF4213/DUF364 family)
MGFETATVELLAQACDRLAGHGTVARVRALHLPPRRPDDPLAGESCALELDDGSIGLSYVLFGDALDRLRADAPGLAGAAALALAGGLGASAQARRGIDRTLGLAAANALTAWIFGRAGYAPPPATDSIASIDPQPGERVGMVGYFAPLLPAIAAARVSLVVVELREDLLGERDGVSVTADPAALADCDKVVATGTVLLNGTLERMRAAARRARRFALIGPSAGLLPDALFDAGVTDLGGSWIEDGPAFLDALRRGERRGRSARKFTLDARAYPGLPALLAAALPGRQ